MVHLKLILDTRRLKSDGTYPIVFRVTDVKKVALISSGYSVKENEWDIKSRIVKGKYPNASVINASLSKRFYEIQKAIISLTDANTFSVENLKELIYNPTTNNLKCPTFLDFSNQIIKSFIEVKRTGNALVYITAVNRLINFSQNSSVKFSEINYIFLERFMNALRTDGLRENSVGNYLRSIRAIFNKAIKANIISRDAYPFNGITIKTEKTAKRAITLEHLSKIYKSGGNFNSSKFHASNFFFLSFALRGISFTDMAYLKKENIINDYLTYRRRKTKKLYKIKLHPEAKRLISIYSNNNSNYLLPIFPLGTIEDSVTAKKITRQWIKTTNKHLNRIAVDCGLELNLTSYVARHTWATIAKKIGYSNELIAEALGHEFGNKITNIYLDTFEQEVIDDMNANILKQLFNFKQPTKLDIQCQ